MELIVGIAAWIGVGYVACIIFGRAARLGSDEYDRKEKDLM